MPRWPASRIQFCGPFGFVVRGLCARKRCRSSAEETALGRSQNEDNQRPERDSTPPPRISFGLDALTGRRPDLEGAWGRRGLADIARRECTCAHRQRHGHFCREGGRKAEKPQPPSQFGWYLAQQKFGVSVGRGNLWADEFASGGSYLHVSDWIAMPSPRRSTHECIHQLELTVALLHRVGQPFAAEIEIYACVRRALLHVGVAAGIPWPRASAATIATWNSLALGSGSTAMLCRS